jgi:hypothetical protein
VDGGHNFVILLAGQLVYMHFAMSIDHFCAIHSDPGVVSVFSQIRACAGRPRRHLSCCDRVCVLGSSDTRQIEAQWTAAARLIERAERTVTA